MFKIYNQNCVGGILTQNVVKLNQGVLELTLLTRRSILEISFIFPHIHVFFLYVLRMSPNYWRVTKYALWSPPETFAAPPINFEPPLEINLVNKVDEIGVSTKTTYQ